MMPNPFAHIPLTGSAACYAAGYGIAAAIFWWMARRRRIATDGIATLMGAGLIGGLIAANAVQFLATGEPGKTVLGAVAGGYLAVAATKRYLGIRRPTGDLFAVALSAGEAVGRWGCFFGGCCYGRPTSVPWAIWQHDSYRHPTQIYMSAANAIILAVLLRFDRKSPPENALFYLQGLLYCATRFAIEFYRDVPVSIGGLTTAQWACLAGMTFFGVSFAHLMRRSTVVAKGVAAAESV